MGLALAAALLGLGLHGADSAGAPARFAEPVSDTARAGISAEKVKLIGPGAHEDGNRARKDYLNQSQPECNRRRNHESLCGGCRDAYCAGSSNSSLERCASKYREWRSSYPASEYIHGTRSRSMTRSLSRSRFLERISRVMTTMISMPIHRTMPSSVTNALRLVRRPWSMNLATSWASAIIRPAMNFGQGRTLRPASHSRTTSIRWMIISR